MNKIVENQQSNCTQTTPIDYPRLTSLYQDIAMCRELSKVTGEANCMTLEGCTGAGKTTLVRAYANDYPSYETDLKTITPILYVETPSPVTVKGLSARILQELGDPMAHNGTQWAMNSRIAYFIDQCGVDFVILDDIQHLIARNKILEEVSDWLKVLLKETNIPFLIIGLEDTVEKILDVNPQLSRLFAVRRKLKPFSWDTKQTQREYSIFLTYAIEKRLQLSMGDDFPRGEMFKRIHYATDGVAANTMNLLFATQWLGEKEGNSGSVTNALLHKAFEVRLSKHLPHKKNPFKQKPTQSFQEKRRSRKK